MDEHLLTGHSLLNCQVCSTGSEDEALAWVRKTWPAGTTNNWGKYDYSDHPNMAPVKCEKEPTRTHYMFVC